MERWLFKSAPALQEIDRPRPPLRLGTCAVEVTVERQAGSGGAVRFVPRCSVSRDVIARAPDVAVATVWRVASVAGFVEIAWSDNDYEAPS